MDINTHSYKTLLNHLNTLPVMKRYSLNETPKTTCKLIKDQGEIFLMEESSTNNHMPIIRIGYVVSKRVIETKDKLKYIQFNCGLVFIPHSLKSCSEITQYCQSYYIHGREVTQEDVSKYLIDKKKDNLKKKLKDL